MRQLTYVSTGHLEWREAPQPQVKEPTDAVVRPVVSTTCDLDKVFLAGHTVVPPPFAIGHECIARVVACGDAVTHVRPGDLVIVPWHIACGRCDRCTLGLTAHCLQAPPLAMFGCNVGGEWGGLFDDYVRVPWADAMLVPVPDGVDLIGLASASDNLSLAWRLVAPHLADRPGGSVLILNRGSIGLFVADIARALGAGRRLFVDPDPERRALASRWGAEVADSYEPEKHGFDIAVETTGSSAQLALALRSLVPEGVCESAGNHYRSQPLPLLEMYFNAVRFRVARDSVRGNIEPVLDLAVHGRIQPRLVVSHVLDYDQLPDALPQGLTKPVFVREISDHHLQATDVA